MDIQEQVAMGPKTTMRIGGKAQYYAEPKTKEDVEQAWQFAQSKNIPLIVLGGGSNTVFADGVINALVIRIKADTVTIEDETVTVEAAKNLPMLINELAAQGFDLSPLTGILGTVGGAVYGNAGQGPKGIWMDTYIENIEVFSSGEWSTMSKADCDFSYRESAFKHMDAPPIIWSTTMKIPKGEPEVIKKEIERLLKQRIETQPHVKTAGSCFKAVGDTPAWKLIDAAGLRGKTIGGVNVSEKHANFLINGGNATYQDAKDMVEAIRSGVAEPLDVEMRFIENDGSTKY